MKYCEVCGNKNTKASKFCRICGNLIGSHVSNAADGVTVDEGTVDEVEDTTSDEVFIATPISGDYDQELLRSTSWIEGGILKALIALLFRPNSSSAQDVFLSSNAPKVEFTVILNTIAVFMFAYIDAQHTTAIYNGTPLPADPLTSAFVKVIFFMITWYVGSLLLGYLIKSAVSEESIIRALSYKIGRKINAVRSMFFIVFNLVAALLIPKQPEYIYETNDLFSPEALTVIQTRGLYYTQVLITIQTITYAISALYLYFWLRKSLKLRNNLPIVLPILTILFLFIYKNPALAIV